MNDYLNPFPSQFFSFSIRINSSAFEKAPVDTRSSLCSINLVKLAFILPVSVIVDGKKGGLRV